MSDLSTSDPETDRAPEPASGVKQKSSNNPQKCDLPADLRNASSHELAIVAHALSEESSASHFFGGAIARHGDPEFHLAPKAARTLAAAVRRRLASHSLTIVNRNPQRLEALLKPAAV